MSNPQIVAETAAITTLWAAKQYGFSELAPILAREVAMCITRTIAARTQTLTVDQANFAGTMATIGAITRKEEG